MTLTNYTFQESGMANQAVEPEEADAQGNYSVIYSPSRPHNAPRNSPPLDNSYRPQSSHYSTLNLGFEPLDPIFDPLSVVIPPSYHYADASHRHMDIRWMTTDRNSPCFFHPTSCGVFAMACDCCGPMVVCYSCRQHMVHSSRTACPRCNRRPMIRECFIPLY